MIYDVQKKIFTFALKNTGCSAARLARVVRDDEAGGSNPLTPTTQMKASLQSRQPQNGKRKHELARCFLFLF